MPVSDALRIHVDDGGEAGSSHRNSGGREELRGPHGEGARAVCLPDELRAMLAAEPEERRRPEELGVAETRLQLLQRLLCVVGRGPADDDADEMPVRRIAEHPATVE